MKVLRFVMVWAVTMALVSISPPSVAQQSTVDQCEDEWRANKAENQAKGFKEGDYVAQCRDGFVPAPAVTLRWDATTAETTKAVSRRSSRKQLHPAPTTARRAKAVTKRSKATLSAASATTRAGKALARRSSKESSRLPSGAPATAAGTPKGTAGRPAGVGDREGSVDW